MDKFTVSNNLLDRLDMLFNKEILMEIKSEQLK